MPANGNASNASTRESAPPATPPTKPHRPPQLMNGRAPMTEGENTEDIDNKPPIVPPRRIRNEFLQPPTQEAANGLPPTPKVTVSSQKEDNKVYFFPIIKNLVESVVIDVGIVWSSNVGSKMNIRDNEL